MKDEDTTFEPLKDKILDIISGEGPITFERFMDAALYDPDWGYYTSGKKRVGFKGDFFTSPAMSPVFGMTLARFMPIADEALNHPESFTMIELGAGDGRTARQIMETLEDTEPELYSRAIYICVDRGWHGKPFDNTFDGKILWARDLSDMGSVEGFALSNEFFDALPVRRVIMTPEGLREIRVGASGGRFIDVAVEPDGSELDEYLRHFGVELAVGQEAEVCFEARRWIESISDVLAAGLVLTIDYGYAAAELYGPHRKRGTLMAYHGHEATEDYYEDVGDRDLTAHVNFTALEEWGADSGLDIVAFTDQLRLFLDLGIHEVFARIESQSSDFAAFQLAMQPAKALIMPGGMGETFKALVQAKGVPGERLGKIKGKIKSKHQLS